MESCRKSHDIPLRTTPVVFTVPQGFPPTVYNFQNNPLTEEGIALGKKLFYDGRLSIDGNFPCVSCHQPVAAFTTFEHDRSHGYNNSHTMRNAPGLFNLAWYPAFHQDGSASTLETVFEKHITDPDEMGETINNVISKIRQDETYQQMFRDAFGEGEIDKHRMYNALSQFVISLVSINSKYDRVKKGWAVFTQTELNGYNFFKVKCVSCHVEPLFTDFSYRNTGLAKDNQLNDLGRMMVTGNPSDSLKFRVPSLRNIDFTSYYGHDGRFSMFRMMLQHYRFGVNPGPTLDPLVSGGIQMTDTEENELVAFLRTLGDSTFLNDPRYR